MIKRVVAGIGATVCTAVVLIPAVAHATTYRYWSYWTGGDSWSYSSRGPGFGVPADGGVEGWRFVLSPADGSQAAAPSTASSFEQLCPGQPPAPAGRKRVAVVIDFGPAGIAPVGEAPPATSTSCVTVPSAATGLQVLQEVTETRFHSSGLICGIGGFPARECPGQSADVVAEPDPTGQPTNQAPSVAEVPSIAPTDNAAVVPSAPEPSPTGSPPPTPARTSAPTDQPTAMALTAPAEPVSAQPTQPPAWIAAIGATMIAVLLGVAALIRRGRQ